MDWSFPNRACTATDAYMFGRTRVIPTCDLLARYDDNELIDIEVNSRALRLRRSSCGTGTYSQEGTWIHELGHAYGYDHFDDWLSTMNTLQPDVSSCRGDWSERPSSDNGWRRRLLA